MFSGIATMADSLAAMNILLQERTYGEILQILADDFAGHEELRQRIRNSFPKFGNGSPEADKAAASIANTLIDAFEDAAGETGFLPMASLYSLTRHHSFGSNLGATPDGRKAGTQISENQSPVHGMDTEGISAMLRSVAALPLHRCISGGLNVKLTSRLSSEQFAGIIKSFFEMNGQHIGFSVVDQATLQAALAAPEDYKSLCIRITGYSEYFNNLSPETKKEVIARTGF
jgi:formate C-acetyltransferase